MAAVREQGDDARKYFEAALRIGEAHSLGDVTPRALEGLGMAAFYADDMELAQRWYDKALDARIRQSGETHPKVSETLTALGSIAYMQDDSQRAEKFWLRSLEVDRRILGPTHPDLAITLNNLGLLSLERRDFDRAIEILTEAVALMSAQQSEIHDTLVFGVNNLARAHMGRGDLVAAEPLFERALRAAVATKHRLEGPILTDLADLECRTARPDKGLARLDAARPIVAARYPDDPWRVAHVDNIRGDCLARLGRAVEAERLISESAATVLVKWPAETYYGHDTLERAARVYGSTGNRAKLAQLQRLASKAPEFAH